MSPTIAPLARRAPTLDSAAAGPKDALDFILCEHMRHRVMCNALDALADAERFDTSAVTRLAEFIRDDLSIHIADEEEVFFPMLRQRCLPEDEAEAALERMDNEHEADRELSAQVRVFLLAAATNGLPMAAIPGAPEALKQFAQSQRRHMMLENAVLIPLARRRLNAEDLAELGARLAARRRR